MSAALLNGWEAWPLRGTWRGAGGVDARRQPGRGALAAW